MTVDCLAATIGWLSEICEVAKTPALAVEAAMPAAQVEASKPRPCGLVAPPKPCQRATGTSASKSISSASLARPSVFGQLMSSRPSRSDITQPLSRLVWKVPSFSLRLLKAGLVSLRSCWRVGRAVIAVLSLHAPLYGRDVAAGLRRRDDFRLARGKPVERRLHGVDFVGRDHDRAVAVGVHEVAAPDCHAVHVHVDAEIDDVDVGVGGN